MLASAAMKYQPGLSAALTPNAPVFSALVVPSSGVPISSIFVVGWSELLAL
jgi:hypothetical protein